MATLTSDRKIIISKDMVEVYSFHNFYNYGQKNNKKINNNKKNEKKFTPSELYRSPEEEEEAKKRFRLVNRIRSQQNLVRLVNSNKVYDRGRHSFLTLTYKEDMRDIKTAQRDFAKFIQRLNYLLSNGKSEKKIKYIAVIEFQDKHREGVIHFHVILFDVPYIHWHTITKCWSHGSIDICARDKSGKAMTVTMVAKYMSKYMAKGFEDIRLNSKKKYFGSTSLERPIMYREPAHVDTIHSLLSAYPPANIKKYSSKFMGDSLYILYEKIPIEVSDHLAYLPPPPPRYINTSDF